MHQIRICGNGARVNTQQNDRYFVNGDFIYLPYRCNMICYHFQLRIDVNSSIKRKPAFVQISAWHQAFIWFYYVITGAYMRHMWQICLLQQICVNRVIEKLIVAIPLSNTDILVMINICINKPQTAGYEVRRFILIDMATTNTSLMTVQVYYIE